MVGIEMYTDIQKLKTLGYKKQRAARQLKIDNKTVRKYWNMTEEEYISYYLEAKERAKIMDPYRSYVLSKLKTYPEITSAIIYDHLREDFADFLPSYRSVRLYVSNLRESEGIPAPITIRQYGENPELPFGFQAQVDLGQKTMKDISGRKVRIYIFAMVLSSSRYKYTCFQLDPFTAQTFIEAHDRAFKYLGGRPAEIVYDQERVMVVSENAGNIIFTETFEKYRNYAGFSVHLCRGNDPESKGKIEAVIKYIKYNFLSCRVFNGIARLNSDALAWLDRTGNGLVHETTKMIPAMVFAEEQKHLKPAPELSSPIIPKTSIVRKNNIVVYKQNRYVMPKGTYHPGRNIRIETDETAGVVRFLDFNDHSLIEEYRIERGIGKRVCNSHPERDKFTKYQKLKEKAEHGFKGNDKANIFLENVMRLKVRYIRDQLSIIVKLQNQYNREELSNAIDYCFERELFSAIDLRDTLKYFHQEPDQTASKVDIPLKYSIITAQTRPLEVYSELFAGGAKN